MNQGEISSQLKQIIHKGTRGRVAPDDLSHQTDLLTEVGLDSLEALDILLLIEEKFKVTIDDEDLSLELFTTLTNLVDYVSDRL